MRRQWHDLWRWSLLVSMVVSLACTPPGPNGAGEQIALPTPPRFDADRFRRSVVRVLPKIFEQSNNAVGSGVLIKVTGTTGYILTAYHVIKKDLEAEQTQIEVEFYLAGRRQARLSRRYADRVNDVAILVVDNLPTPPPPPLSWGASVAMREPQQVYAIGHTIAEQNWLIQPSTVSLLEQNKIYFPRVVITEGFSGGPLLNGQGELIGIVLGYNDYLAHALEGDVIQSLIRRWVEDSPAPELTPSRPQIVASPPPSQSPSISSSSEANPLPPVVTPSALTTMIQGKDGKEMRLVPEGWFSMGSSEADVEDAVQRAKRNFSNARRAWFDDEQPQHQVWLEAFYMDTYEVTVGEYDTFRRATGHRALPEWVGTYAPDARAYCRWAEKQLPTEAQWERAARGTDRRRYPWGNTPLDGQRANFCDKRCDQQWKDAQQDDGYSYTAPVGSYALGQGPYGHFDLAGNVWEWVQDGYEATYYQRSPERNPVNEQATAARVLRGGGWYSPPVTARVAYRYRGAPDTRHDGIGFRCVVGVAGPRK